MAPYKAPEKKGKKKKDLPEAREGLRRRGRPDTKSGDTAALSAQYGDEEKDKEESTSTHSKKRAASGDAEVELPPQTQKRQCMPKLIMSDSSDSKEESVPSKKVLDREPRIQPPASRYIFWHFSCFIFDNPYSWKLIV